MIVLLPSRTVAIDLFGWSIHWYGLLYLAAFLFAWILLPRLQRHRGFSLSADDWAEILSWAVLGVLVGGRLGFVLFYEPARFLARPWEILAIWQGGMSSHGGFLGVTLALLWVLRKRSGEILALADVIVVPAALGLALGRVGNLINYELYGTVTDLPWGIAIPGVEGLRHPTQIYAVAKDLCIALVCYVHLWRVPVRPGRTFAIFLMLYGVLRFLLEFLRVQDYGGLDLGIVALTRGQLLTLPVFLAGAVLFRWIGKRAGAGGAAGR